MRVVERLLLAAALVAFAGSQPAWAAVEMYSLGGSTANLGPSTNIIGSDGNTVNVTGWQGTGNGNAPFVFGGSGLQPRNLHRNSAGMGVYDTSNGDNSQLDGSPDGNAELMNFHFSSAVRLLKVGFTYIGSDDDFDFSVNNVDVALSSSQHDLGNLPNQTFVVPATLTFNAPGSPTGPAIGTDFAFYTHDSNDDYRVEWIVVENAVIPEPATLAIWSLFSAAGFGYRWRKRRTKRAS